MATGTRTPRGPAKPQRVPRRFDASDPERQPEAAPQGRERDEAVRALEDRQRRAPESDDEGGRRRR